MNATFQGWNSTRRVSVREQRVHTIHTGRVPVFHLWQEKGDRPTMAEEGDPERRRAILQHDQGGNDGWDSYRIRPSRR